MRYSELPYNQRVALKIAVQRLRIGSQPIDLKTGLYASIETIAALRANGLVEQFGDYFTPTYAGYDLFQKAVDAGDETQPVAMCADCQLPYEDRGWIEAYAPDKVWKQISPNGQGDGLLCVICMKRRCESMGLTNVHFRYSNDVSVHYDDIIKAFNRIFGLTVIKDDPNDDAYDGLHKIGVVARGLLMKLDPSFRELAERVQRE